METEQDLQAARDKLAARFGNATQIGGKGTFFITTLWASALLDRLPSYR